MNVNTILVGFHKRAKEVTGFKLNENQNAVLDKLHTMIMKGEGATHLHFIHSYLQDPKKLKSLLEHAKGVQDFRLNAGKMTSKELGTKDMYLGDSSNFRDDIVNNFLAEHSDSSGDVDKGGYQGYINNKVPKTNAQAVHLMDHSKSMGYLDKETEKRMQQMFFLKRWITSKSGLQEKLLNEDEDVKQNYQSKLNHHIFANAAHGADTGAINKLLGQLQDTGPTKLRMKQY